MEQTVVFGTMTKHRADHLFNMAADEFFKDPRCPMHFRQLLMDLLNQPYLRYMMSVRHNLPGTAYHFSMVGEEMDDSQLRGHVLRGINFAWHLMGPAWVMGMVNNLGMLFAGYFITEAYEQFRTTMYNTHVRIEPNPVALFPIIDDYLVTMFTNMECCFRPGATSVEMICRVLHFMNASVEQIQLFCTRTKAVSSKINHNYTLH